MKRNLFFICIIFLLIDISYSNSEDQNIEISPTPGENNPVHPSNFEKCDFTIDIYSWKEIYFREPWIMDPDGNTYKSEKSTTEKILKENLAPDSILCINKHRDCQLTNQEIWHWAEKLGIGNIIIRALPIFLERNNQKGLKRLLPLAI
jgi:hypothetical protein